MTIDVEKNYALFKKWVNEFILIGDDPSVFTEWLDTTDFKVAPASTKYHMDVEGGLCRHSLNVFKRLIRLMKAEYGEEENWKYDRATIAVVGLLNGISKVGTYKKYAKNVRNDETGQWETQIAYTVLDDNARLVYGSDVETTIMILRKFFYLTEDMEMAIRYHKGAFDADDWESKNDLSLAFAKHPLILMLHMAEMQATYLDENDKSFEWAYDVDKFLDARAKRIEEERKKAEEEAKANGTEVESNTEEAATESDYIPF